MNRNLLLKASADKDAGVAKQGDAVCQGLFRIHDGRNNCKLTTTVTWYAMNIINATTKPSPNFIKNANTRSGHAS